MEWNGGEETHRKKVTHLRLPISFYNKLSAYILCERDLGKAATAELRREREKSSIKYQQFRINAYYILAEIFPNYALDSLEFFILQRLSSSCLFFSFFYANSHHVAFMLCYIFIPSHKLDGCVIIAHKNGMKFELYCHSFTPFVSCAIQSWFDVDDDDDSGADQVRVGLAYDCFFFFIRQSNDIIERRGRSRKFTCF